MHTNHQHNSFYFFFFLPSDFNSQTYVLIRSFNPIRILSNDFEQTEGYWKSIPLYVTLNTLFFEMWFSSQ